MDGSLPESEVFVLKQGLTRLAGSNFLNPAPKWPIAGANRRLASRFI
jgi:hypothetical protein